MSRCTCSYRALELFLKDLAGLRIPGSASRVPISYQRRHFVTRPPFRQRERIAAAHGAGIDDEFIPFEVANGTSAHVVGAATVTGKRGKDEDEKGVDEEWHAEIEIATTRPSRTIDPQAQRSDIDASISNPDAVGAEHARSRNAQDHCEQSERLPPLQHSVTQDLAILEPPAHTSALAAPPESDALNSETRSRAENRLARKQRRMAEGTWAAKRVERKTAAADKTKDDDRTQSMLAKIDGLDGPPVEQRKAKDKKEMIAQAKGPDTLKSKHSERRTAGVKEDSKKAKGKKLAEVKAEGAAGLETKRAERKTIKSNVTVTKETGSKKAAMKTTAQRSEEKDKPKRELWQTQKAPLQSKFGDTGWKPSKKVSPDTMAGIRALHASDPAAYTTATLSRHFQVSPEAIRRILRSKWRPNEAEAEDRRQRWEKRGIKKWGEMAEKGIRPPKKWRELGVGWDKKSRSGTARSVGAARRIARGKERMEEDYGVGMLAGLEDGFEERLV